MQFKYQRNQKSKPNLYQPTNNPIQPITLQTNKNTIKAQIQNNSIQIKTINHKPKYKTKQQTKRQIQTLNTKQTANQHY